MIDDVYNKRILELAADIPRLGRLAAPDASARVTAKLCGSTMIVDIVVKDGVIADFAHEVKACALGQAAASLMARHVVGTPVEELRQLRDIMHRMLKENGEPPQGRWQDFAVFTPVRAFRERHASTLLTFDAIVAALNDIDARQSH